MIDDLENEGTVTLHWADTPMMLFPLCFLCGDQVDFTWGAHYVRLSPSNNKGVAIHASCFDNLINASINFRDYFMHDIIDNTEIIH